MNLQILVLSSVVYLASLLAGHFNIMIAQMLRSQACKTKSFAGNPFIGNILYAINLMSLLPMSKTMKSEADVVFTIILAFVLVGLTVHVFSPPSMREYGRVVHHPDNSNTAGAGSPSAQPAH